jgi:hypothetical protein
LIECSDSDVHEESVTVLKRVSSMRQTHLSLG